MAMWAFTRKKILRTNHSHGFSLIELLVVVGILSILIAAAIPALTSSSNHARRASSEIVQAQLQQARAHAISSGHPTALAVPELGSPDELGGRAISILQVKKIESGYVPLAKDQAPYQLLQRWERLPGNFFLVSSSQLGSTTPTFIDLTDRLEIRDRGSVLRCHMLVFNSTGQVVHPPPGNTLLIALAQAVDRGGALTLTQKNQGKPVVDQLTVNRLTGRTRSLSL